MILPVKHNFSRQVAKLEGIEASTIRRIRDMVGVYEQASGVDPDTIIYEVYAIKKLPRNQEHLLTGTCVVYPGKIGSQYFMTKGHRHVIPRAEVYVGITGEGFLIMQHENTHECRIERIEPDSIIYVPPFWSHRHVNSGVEPLVTMFSVAADAGHDYDYIVQNPFRFSIVATENGPEIK